MAPLARRTTEAARRLLPAVLVLVPVALLPPACPAQAPGPDGTYYARQFTFYIPFQVDPGERRIREVQLYASENRGTNWDQVAVAKPAETRFSFTARHDGVYWFTVRTLDNDNHGYPPTLEQVQPRLKVCVDTQPPVVTLRPVQSPDGPAAVEWEVRDDNPDPEGLRLDYRPTGSSDWQPLSIQKALKGQRAWNPGSNAPVEVRLQARDLAGNTGEATTTVTPGASPRADAAGPGDPGAGGVNVRIVNSKRISINFELKDVGKSGIATLELWYTRNEGRKWQKYDERSDPQSPYVVEVSEEGLYGFTLVARNKAGGGEPPPKVGDPPQIWVEVDLTKPVVHLQDVLVGRGAEMGTLTITYTAGDKNLARRPITLSYAEKLEGPWVPIAANEENTGRYVWRMPESVPYQFHVRVEAADKAGNTGSAETSKPVIVDLSQPKVQVIGIGTSP
jgi:hypothetical protein